MQMTEKEREYTTGICEVMKDLPEEDQKHLLWMGKGMVIATKHQREEAKKTATT